MKVKSENYATMTSIGTLCIRRGITLVTRSPLPPVIDKLLALDTTRDVLLFGSHRQVGYQKQIGYQK